MVVTLLCRFLTNSREDRHERNMRRIASVTAGWTSEQIRRRPSSRYQQHYTAAVVRPEIYRERDLEVSQGWAPGFFDYARE